MRYTIIQFINGKLQHLYYVANVFPSPTTLEMNVPKTPSKEETANGARETRDLGAS